MPEPEGDWITEGTLFRVFMADRRVGAQKPDAPAGDWEYKTLPLLRVLMSVECRQSSELTVAKTDLLIIRDEPKQMMKFLDRVKALCACLRISEARLADFVDQCERGGSNKTLVRLNVRGVIRVCNKVSWGRSGSHGGYRNVITEFISPARGARLLAEYNQKHFSEVLDHADN